MENPCIWTVFCLANFLVFRGSLFNNSPPAASFNENNDLNPLTAYYFSFMLHLWTFIGFVIHLCWFYLRYIFSTNYYGPVDVCLLGVKKGALGYSVRYGRRWWWRHHNDVNDVALVVSLLFALDMFRIYICSFRFWVWAWRRLCGIVCCKQIFLHFYNISGFGKSWAISWLVLWAKY